MKLVPKNLLTGRAAEEARARILGMELPDAWKPKKKDSGPYAEAEERLTQYAVRTRLNPESEPGVTAVQVGCWFPSEQTRGGGREKTLYGTVQKQLVGHALLDLLPNWDLADRMLVDRLTLYRYSPRSAFLFEHDNLPYALKTALDIVCTWLLYGDQLREWLAPTPAGKKLMRRVGYSDDMIIRTKLNPELPVVLDYHQGECPWDSNSVGIVIYLHQR